MATKSSNNILVNDKGQIKHSRQSKGKISVFKHNQFANYAEADAGSAYENLDTYKRSVLHIKPNIFIIMDQLLAITPSVYNWLLHSYYPFKFNPNSHKVTTRNGPAELTVQFLYPEELKMHQTDQFEPQPELEKWRNLWHFRASTTDSKRAKEFFTLLEVTRKGEKSPVCDYDLKRTENSVKLNLKTENCEYTVIFNMENGSKNIERVSVYKMKEYGEPVRLFIVN